MPWYGWVALGALGGIAAGVIVRNAERALRWLSARAIRRRAERKWRAYAKKLGKDWRELTPREKLEAHGLPRDGS
jgi:hypothetical protein